MAEHQEALRTVFAEMREPWWNEDILEDIDTDTDRRLEAESRRKRQGASYKTFPNQGFVETVFLMLHGFGLVFIPCYLILGVTLIGWVSSVQAITQDDQSLTPSIFNQTLVGDGSYNMNAVGIMYICYTIFLLAISLLTLKAVYSGSATRIKVYLFVNFVGLLWEIIMLIVAQHQVPMDSCELGWLEERLTDQMKWYGLINVPKPIIPSDSETKESQDRFLGYEAVLKMNSIQEALGCCGIDGYKDYTTINENINWFPDEAINMTYTVRTDTGPGKLHRELDSIPNTCCKPIWRENIYCAAEIYEQEDFVSQRINENGCSKEVKKVCENVLYLINVTTLRIILLRILFFMFAAWILWYIIQMLAWEKIQAFEALLEMQRPNLAGFDLADAIAKLKPITSETQALPGQRLARKKVERLLSVVSSAHEINSQLMWSGGAGQPLRNESIWEEHQRLDKQRFYKAKTSEQVEKFSSILKNELGEIPEDLNLEEAAKHHHHHHHHGHHDHKSKSESALDHMSEPGADGHGNKKGEIGSKPAFRTVSNVLGRVVSRIREHNKVHPSTDDKHEGATELEPIHARSFSFGSSGQASDLQLEGDENEYQREGSPRTRAAGGRAKKKHKHKPTALPLFSEDDGGAGAGPSDAVFIFDTDHENFDTDDDKSEFSEYSADADDEEEGRKRGGRGHSPRSHAPQDRGRYTSASAQVKESELKKIFDKSYTERSQEERVQALSASTGEFGDRTVSILEEQVTPATPAISPEPKRKKKKKTRTKKTKRKKPKPPVKRSWNEFWWTEH